MESEPLHCLEPTRWSDLQNAFQSDWPRGLAAYYVLETQKSWHSGVLDYGFKVFCPFGDLELGMVAVNDKMGYYEILIQCPKDDTSALEVALQKTNAIDWTRSAVVPFASDHIVQCVRRVIADVNMELHELLPSYSFVKYKTSQPFGDVRLPQSIKLGFLKPEHVDLVNAHWFHRYSTSSWYFSHLIEAKAGYALYHGDDVVSWVFVNDHGILGHLFTLEEHRRKGYGVLLLKLVSNVLLEDGKDVVAYVVKLNQRSAELFKLAGFESFNDVAWCFLRPKGSPFILCNQ